MPINAFCPCRFLPMKRPMSKAVSKRAALMNYLFDARSRPGKYTEAARNLKFHRRPFRIHVYCEMETARVGGLDIPSTRLGTFNFLVGILVSASMYADT